MSRATVITDKACHWCGRRFGRDTRYSARYFAQQRFCSITCAGAHRSLSARSSRLPIRGAFARWFDATDEGCWEWTGARDRDGYGVFSYWRKSMRAPVVALHLDGRPPRPGEYACHHCDNPACVRPDHLYPGTPRDNSLDAMKRGRAQRGERHYAARLTERDVRVIRGGGASDTEFAARFGVSRPAVTMARNGKTWKHIT